MHDDLSTIRNFRRLDERLITSGQPSETELAALAAAGYQVVINLALHDDSYSLADERSTVEGLGMTYVHLPIIFTNPTPEDFAAFRAALRAHEGRQVLVHCAANKRVSAFMFLYRVLEQGWRPADAADDLHALWRPNEVWQSWIDRMLEK